jgi:restriction system protein
VVVCCAAGFGGPVSIKRVRELFGTLAVEGVPTGWFVSPAGFAHEARVYAEDKGLVLIDGGQLLEQLRNLPPMVLPKVLARAV